MRRVWLSVLVAGIVSSKSGIRGTLHVGINTNSLISGHLLFFKNYGSSAILRVKGTILVIVILMSTPNVNNILQQISFKKWEQ